MIIQQIPVAIPSRYGYLYRDLLYNFCTGIYCIITQEIPVAIPNRYDCLYSDLLYNFCIEIYCMIIDYTGDPFDHTESV